MQRLQDDDQLAVATSRLHMKTLSIQDNIYCFDTSQNIYDYSTVFMIRNKFQIKSQFINVLDKISTAGLIGKWEKDLERRPNVTVRLFMEEHAYSMDDFAAIALYLSLIIVGSIGAFIAEFIVYNRKHIERPAERHPYINTFWDLCDKFICGKRHYFLLESSQQQTQAQK